MYGDRIYADFQNLDDDNRVRLTCAGTEADLKSADVSLTAGRSILLYTDDEDDAGQFDPLLVDGTVEFNSAEQCWVARVDWATVRHASAVQAVPKTAVNGTPNPNRVTSTPVG